MASVKLILVSLTVGALVLVVGESIPAIADGIFQPGLLLAAPFWPQGFHSDFSGPADVMTMLVVIWGGSWLLWSGLTFVAVRLWSRVVA